MDPDGLSVKVIQGQNLFVDSGFLDDFILVAETFLTSGFEQLFRSFCSPQHQ